ncbi:Protein kinase superfamily protein [Klebsormidium nitens]|uniref:non-specific serine/threonine protein kinase n=1 Tax=Klebsormidium nitens TaxID=105231 RepID=A0A1Y1HKV0_KLENI|nr:Protein kinase superfamily protein [Klebsormidium nitens]|eukprot:GAQ77759.1 Protein kinase superfamily protein [Klebsormidium nitens]
MAQSMASAGSHTGCSPVKQVHRRALNKGPLRNFSLTVRAQGEEDRLSFQEYLERQPELPPTVSSSPPQFKPLHEIGDVIVGKYRITGVLGSGGLGTMFEAELVDSNGSADSDSPSGVAQTWEEAVAASKSGGERSTKVALKAMSLRGMKAWKDLELFEREARVLQSLKHPGIAEYIDSFEVDTDADRTFYIAQKVAPGKSIADLVKGGWRVGEEEVKRIALEVLKVLEYLQSLRPAVVHRDIKPENIIIDSDGAGRGTGAVKVVDFGAVQDQAAATFLGSTVVGTYGYMAPEQFRGKAVPQSDLYALGATMLYMLSGRPPSEFPQRRLKVEFRDRVSMSPGLADVLDRLLEPAVEDRYQSAAEVARAISGANDRSSIGGWVGRQSADTRVPESFTPLRKPAGSKVELERSGGRIHIEVPPQGLTEQNLSTGTFALAWNGFIAFWTASAITGGAPILFSLFSIPFWAVGFGLAKSALSGVSVKTTLDIGVQNFTIKWEVAGGLWSHTVEGRTDDLASAQVVMTGSVNGQPLRNCQVAEGIKKHTFGDGLTEVEKKWVVSELATFLKSVNPGYRGPSPAEIEQSAPQSLQPPFQQPTNRKLDDRSRWRRWNDFDDDD